MSSSPEIFFSYAWGDEQEQGGSREKIVNELYDSLIKDKYQVVRDKYNLEYKGFISDFMSQIGRGKCIIVAISQKYVKSPYCMFELYEIARNSNFDKIQFREKVIPLRVELIDFNDPATLEKHFAFWDNEYKKWDELVKKRAEQLSVGQLQDYDRIKMIHQNFGRLTDWIKDMNTLNLQTLSADNFAAIKKAIIKKGAADPDPVVGFWRRLVKKQVFWIAAVSTIAAIILITSWLSRKRTTQLPQRVFAFNLVSPAGEQLLIVQDSNNKRFGYAKANDTSLFISCKYEEANPFKEGIALVKIDDKYRWIKPDSADAFSGSYDYAKNFKDSMAIVSIGKDTFYINMKGERQQVPPVVTKKGNTNKERPGTLTEDGSNESPSYKMCEAISESKVIAGIEVSFTDPRNNKKYRQISDGNYLEFDIPCYLLEQTVRVSFIRNGQPDYYNVRIKEFIIPEIFKSN